MIKYKVLEKLEDAMPAILSGESLAAGLGVSRTAVWKAVQSLIKDGYPIEPAANKGYCLCAECDLLSPSIIQKNLKSKYIGHEIEILKTVASTNDYVKDKGRLKPEGYVVLAEEQTKGKGRMNRNFSSAKGQGLFASILLKPNLPLQDMHFITICAAVAVCNAIEKGFGLDAQIKWVNDIYFNEKKLCGILTEGVFQGELNTLEYAVLGIGINTGKVTDTVKDIAVSLGDITGKQNIRNKLAGLVLTEFEALYEVLQQEGGKSAILKPYREKQFLFGSKITVRQGKEVFDAIVKTIDDNGFLVVEDEDNNRRTLSSGEVSLQLNKPDV